MSIETGNVLVGNDQANTLPLATHIAGTREGVGSALSNVGEASSLEIMKIEGAFSGLQWGSLSEEERIIVGDLYTRFMKIDENMHLSIEWFFNLVHEHINSQKNSEIQADEQENPLKTVLFDNNKTPYIRRIIKIINAFEIRPTEMQHLILTISVPGKIDERAMAEAQLLRIEMDDPFIN